MTGTPTWNKSAQPAGTDGWNLLPDLRTLAQTLNAAVPVANQTERDALAPPGGKYAGMAVVRTDISGSPLEVYNGSSWDRHPGLEFTTTPVDTGGDPGTNWNGTMNLRRMVNPDGTKTVWFEWVAIRSNAAAFTTTSALQGSTLRAFPSGWAPTSRFHFIGYGRDASINPVGPVLMQVDNGGAVSLGAMINGVTVPQWGSIHVQGMYRF